MRHSEIAVLMRCRLDLEAGSPMSCAASVQRAEENEKNRGAEGGKIEECFPSEGLSRLAFQK